jgi:hypothetical protein
MTGITMECDECGGQGGWVDFDGYGEQCFECGGAGRVPFDREAMPTLLIAGSRDITKAQAFPRIERAYWKLPGVAPRALISGGARGVDTWGEQWWKDVLGDEDSIIRVVPDWDGLGKRAGYVRNAEMAQLADQAIIIWDGESKGTKHMIDLCEQLGVVTVIEVLTLN